MLSYEGESFFYYFILAYFERKRNNKREINVIVSNKINNKVFSFLRFT
jgi:hypothetical protein